jgi:hypothetical protein
MGDLIGVFAELLEGVTELPWGQIALSVAAGFILLELIGLIECSGIKLLRLSAKVLPPAFRQRYIEENEAVIRTQSGPIAKVLCAISASIGAVSMRFSMYRHELDSLERASQSNRDDQHTKPMWLVGQPYKTFESALCEVVHDVSRRQQILENMDPTKRDHSVRGPITIELPMSEEEFAKVFQLMSQNRQKPRIEN